LFNSIPALSPLRYSDHIEGNGALFFQHACQTGLEGIVSKLRTSHYDSARSRSWLKVKCSKRQEFVITGYTDSSKGLPGFGSLILGVYEEDRLVYAGRVGTGFSIKQRIDLKHRLDRDLPLKHLPFQSYQETQDCVRLIGSNQTWLPR
jgi:bifunctional non-homologous end joining protein LigD